MEDIKTVVSGKLKGMSDEDVLSLLDMVSDEVKRRNFLMGPYIPDPRTQSFDDNMKALFEAFSNFGFKSPP